MGEDISLQIPEEPVLILRGIAAPFEHFVNTGDPFWCNDSLCLPCSSRSRCLVHYHNRVDRKLLNFGLGDLSCIGNACIKDRRRRRHLRFHELADLRPVFCSLLFKWPWPFWWQVSWQPTIWRTSLSRWQIDPWQDVEVMDCTLTLTVYKDIPSTFCHLSETLICVVLRESCLWVFWNLYKVSWHSFLDYLIALILGITLECGDQGPFTRCLRLRWPTGHQYHDFLQRMFLNGLCCLACCTNWQLVLQWWV